jgi:hypothetical protein
MEREGKEKRRRVAARARWRGGSAAGWFQAVYCKKQDVSVKKCKSAQPDRGSRKTVAPSVTHASPMSPVARLISVPFPTPLAPFIAMRNLRPMRKNRPPRHGGGATGEGGGGGGRRPWQRDDRPAQPAGAAGTGRRKRRAGKECVHSLSLVRFLLLLLLPMPAAVCGCGSRLSASPWPLHRRDPADRTNTHDATQARRRSPVAAQICRPLLCVFLLPCLCLLLLLLPAASAVRRSKQKTVPAKKETHANRAQPTRTRTHSGTRRKGEGGEESDGRRGVDGCASHSLAPLCPSLVAHSRLLSLDAVKIQKASNKGSHHSHSLHHCRSVL